jgi:nucleotide-binding universal stress UspA family protein
MLHPLSSELLHDLEHAAEQGLAELVATARAAGVEATSRTRYGSTAREICEQARDLGTDLIVLGTHGRSGLSRALLGSVAERVVRRAPCPVLTVRPHAHAATGATH